MFVRSLMSFAIGFAVTAMAVVPLATASPAADGPHSSLGSAISASSWSLLVKISVGALNDSLASFGVNPAATAGYDPLFDVPCPPFPPGNYVEMSFPHEGDGWPQLLGSRYGVDMTNLGHARWIAVVTTTLGSGLVRMSWDTTGLSVLPSTYFIFMKDSVAGNVVDMRATNSYSFSYSGDRMFSLWVKSEATLFDLKGGWNLVSLPRIPDDRAVRTLFPGATSAAFAYDDGYVTAESMQVGTGYWIRFSGPVTGAVDGDQLTSIMLPMEIGWNLIGGVDHAIAAPAGGIVTSRVFGYDGTYAVVDSMLPGRGYWIKAGSSGFLELGPIPAGKIQDGSREPGPTRLEMSDGSGSRQILYVAEESENPQDRRIFDLPPVAPGSSFDARFTSQQFVAWYAPQDARRSTMTILLRSSHFPIRLGMCTGVANLRLQVVALANASAVTTSEIGNGGTMAIDDRGVNELKVVVLPRPAVSHSFSLDQNYPNPFNGTTTIRYTLPRASRVSFAVFDLLGKEILALPQFAEEEGEHVIRLDPASREWTSGVFLYRVRATDLETGSVLTCSRKLIYLK